MAQALVAGIASAYKDVEFEIADPSPEAREQFCKKVTSSVKVRDTNSEIFRHCDTVFLAIKPQYLEQAIDRSQVEAAIAGLDQEPLVVSIMAGVSIGLIALTTGLKRVARVMPNTPCLIMEGASAVAFSDAVEPPQQQAVIDLLASVGIVVPIAENLIDAVTGLSGSGPAYVFTFIESLIDGGVLKGLPRDVARKLAIQTVIGSAQLVAQTDEHPAVLRDRVTSPGGTTIEGLRVLEVNDFRGTVIQAVEAATNRAKALRERS